MQNEEVKVLEQEALSWPIRAREIQVFDQGTYDMATGLLLTIAALKKRIKDYHAPLKEAANRTHKSICAAENGLIEPLDEARAIISPRLIEWQRKQEAIRLELERKAREEAIRQEEERRLAMAVEAEKLESTRRP